MRPLTVAIVAVEDFSPFHFSVPCIIFSDKMAAKKRFEVQICAEKPGIVSSQDGFSVTASHGYEAVTAADIVVVPYWGTTGHRPPQGLLNALNCARQNGAQIVGLCLGAFVLGYAGLLDGKRAATHWEFEQDFQTRFPAARLDINALYVDDDGIITLGRYRRRTGLLLVRHPPALWQHGSEPDCPTDDCATAPRRGQAQFIEQPVAKNTRGSAH